VSTFCAAPRTVADVEGSDKCSRAWDMCSRALCNCSRAEVAWPSKFITVCAAPDNGASGGGELGTDPCAGDVVDISGCGCGELMGG